MITSKLLSSLEKVFLDEEPTAAQQLSGMALRGERFSFQFSVSRDFEDENGLQRFRVAVESPIADFVTVRSVRMVPSEVPAYPYDKDDDYLRTAPGLFPDALEPPRPNFILIPWQWRTFWISVDVPADMKPGRYPITLRLLKDETGKPVPEDDGKVMAEKTFTLEVLPATLPTQTLKHTEWFHIDCLAAYYGVELWSEDYWRIFGRFVKQAVEHGVNMLLTPIFTPPLDTAPGGERMTMQLVDVTRNGGTYAFGFDRLERYLTIADSKGVRYFELSHLFTQWGAAHAPKIMATVDGEYKRLFGWETDATADEYQEFLRAFLPALVDWIRGHGWLDRTYFHFSDEPHKEHIEQYAASSAAAREILKDCHVIDALSVYEFYERGLIRQPIPGTTSVHEFMEKGVSPIWTYYCCDQTQAVSNHFIAMPSARNRILGWQLYKYNVEGFLTWGYNFWSSQFSLCPINPYEVTDAVCAFPSGDAFMVYPGADGGPVASIHQVVMAEALQDMRAMQLLETMIPKAEIVAKMDALCADGEVTFKQYPRSAQALLDLRAWVNEQIKAHA